MSAEACEKSFMKTEEFMTVPSQYPTIKSATALTRPRVTALLGDAIKHPLVIVCAGMGYGKTRAVLDIVKSGEFRVVWVRCADSDNVVAQFWDSFVGSISPINNTA